MQYKVGPPDGWRSLTQKLDHRELSVLTLALHEGRCQPPGPLRLSQGPSRKTAARIGLRDVRISSEWMFWARAIMGSSYLWIADSSVSECTVSKQGWKLCNGNCCTSCKLPLLLMRSRIIYFDPDEICILRSAAVAAPNNPNHANILPSTSNLRNNIGGGLFQYTEASSSRSNMVILSKSVDCVENPH